MPDLVVEIGTEELPPADVRPALYQLETGVRSAMDGLRVEVDQVKTYGTPRRLVVSCSGVASRQRPAIRAVKGPAARVAYDQEGHPTQAAIGFARSQGVAVDTLRVQDVGGGQYVVATIKDPGRSAAAVLPQALTSVIDNLTFSKTMRWGNGEARFARPVRWVLAVLGGQIIRVEVAGVRAGRKTYGHRFLSGRARTVKTASDYFEVLRTNHVILDADDRRQSIVRQASALAAEVHAVPVLDSRLLEETVMTVEQPVALRGEFSRDFLSLPQEVLATVMQHHQKYFPVEDRQHRLQPYFIAVRDGGRRHVATVREGHEWVLRARLADARFFFNEDRTRRLESYGPSLEGLVLQSQLGTMADKTRRLARLVSCLAETLPLEPRTAEALRRAATLCKADLATHLVGEFPELQGITGQIYAEMDGEPPEVARAIGEHYRPTGAGDSPPATRLGALLALIDKCDTLVGALLSGLAPTGSQDPYGLRRTGQGIVEIILAHHLSVQLSEMVTAAAAGYGKTADEVVEQVIDFLQQRLRALLVDRGLRYDLVDAVLAVSGDALLSAAERAQALQAFAGRPEFVRLYVAYDRASRILTSNTAAAPDPGLFEGEAERRLYETAKTVTPQVRAAVKAGQSVRALEALLPLAAPVDKVFDDVLIMAPDARVRANRLALLRLIVEAFRLVADFSRIVLPAERKSGIRGQGKPVRG